MRRKKRSIGVIIFNIFLITLMFVITMQALVYAHALFLTLLALAILYAVFKG